MSDPWKDAVDQIRDITDAGYSDETILAVLKDRFDLKPIPIPGFAPCPTCNQYSHSLGERQITDAFNHFQSMFSHRGDGIPTQFVFDQKTRDSAQVLMGAIAARRVMDERREALGSKEMDDVRTQIVANMSGGVLQGASCNFPNVELYVLDFEDVPHDDLERVIEIDGSEAYLSQMVCEHEPDFIQKVVEAPTLAEETSDGEAD